MPTLDQLIETLFTKLSSLPVIILHPNSRLFWLWLLSAVALAYVVFRLYPPDGKTNISAFIRFLLPAKVYRHVSFLVDLKIILFSRLLLPPVSWILQGLTTLSVASSVSQLLQSIWQSPISNTELNWFTKALIGGVLFLSYDFARFFSHYLHHRIPVLWRFHAVHHSAEQLNPLTAFRFHPLEFVLQSAIVILIVGTVAGIIMSLYDVPAIDYYQLMLMWLYFRAFQFVGGNLRHSHIWVSWGYHLNHLLISPAQHQIHHSTEERHIDKNLGVVFAVWDWMFGTLYVPKQKEKLSFGIVGQPAHTSLRAALLRPFKEAWADCHRSGRLSSSANQKPRSSKAF